LKDLNTDGRIILKQILNEYTFAWSWEPSHIMKQYVYR
jgi:hypothetical protein